MPFLPVVQPRDHPQKAILYKGKAIFFHCRCAQRILCVSCSVFLVSVSLKDGLFLSTEKSAFFENMGTFFGQKSVTLGYF
eukprot:UN03444